MRAGGRNFLKLSLFSKHFIIIIKLHSEICSLVCIILHLFVVGDLIPAEGSAALFFSAKFVGKVSTARGYLLAPHIMGLRGLNRDLCNGTRSNLIKALKLYIFKSKVDETDE